MLQIRILDTDMERLIGAQKSISTALRLLSHKASVIPVADPLEICRFGLVGAMPALEINGCIRSKGRPIKTEDALELLRKYA